MKLAIALVVIVMFIGLILTIIEIGKSDSDYNSKSKRNIKNLSFVYAATILISLIALAVFVINYTS